jgi:hypothetical protein
MAAMPVNVILNLKKSMPPPVQQQIAQIAGMKEAAASGTPLVHNCMNCEVCAGKQ